MSNKDREKNNSEEITDNIYISDADKVSDAGALFENVSENAIEAENENKDVFSEISENTSAAFNSGNLRFYSNANEENDENGGKIITDYNNKKKSDCKSKKSELIHMIVYFILNLIPSFIVVTLVLNCSSASDNDGVYMRICLISIAVVLILVFFKYFHKRAADHPVVMSLRWLVFFVSPAVGCVILESFSRDLAAHLASGRIKIPVLVLNLIFWYLALLLILVLTKRSGVAATAVIGLSCLLGLVDYYVSMFRGVPLNPWDIMSVKTAANVADNFTFTLNFKTITLVSIAILLIQICILYGCKLKKVKLYVQIPLIVVFAVLMSVYMTYIRGDKVYDDFSLYPYLFTPYAMNERNGITVTFLSNTKYMNPKSPDGYSLDKVNEISESYSGYDFNKSSEGERPNIIAIMNEAWSDLSVLGDFSASEDVFEIYNSLEENTVKGYAYASVKGGNTANSEFEFLCGTSMGFLPVGCIPYQQYIKNEIPNLTSQLSSIGYRTIAMHPYNANGWNRDKVYKYFGFDEMYFKSDFAGKEKLREYYSDRAVYEKIIEIYEEKDQEEELFLFGVTMQNHSAYTKNYSNFSNSVTVKNSSSAALSQYMTLMKYSDEAFGELVEYFKNQDEHTVIIMFGDHQPNDSVVTGILRMNGIYDIYEKELSVQQSRYMVPYIIWANYDISEDTSYDRGNVSMNYLSSILLEVAGIELTPYQKFLTSLMKEYPVITANCFMDSDGKFYSYEDTKLPESVLKYSYVQYNLIFDIKRRCGSFFGAK